MFGKLAALMIASAWGYSSPHHGAFLATHTPDEEVMGPNMNFTPVSTTMQCTINLTLQFMIVFTALGISRTYLDFAQPGKKHTENQFCNALKHASQTVFYAPMVCLMFVGFRMRVLQLSKGQGNPQDWVRYAMQAVAYSILVNTVLVLCVEAFSTKKIETDKKLQGSLKMNGKNPFEEDNAVLKTVFTVLRYVTFLGLYVGFGAVCVGVFLYEPPAGVWEGEIPPLSPAVGCTMILSTGFFLVYFLHAASHTINEYQTTESEGPTFLQKLETALEHAADTFALAPMLCVLFLAARMRALQMDPVGGNPQKWAQNCFYTCTYALMFQTILAIAVPLCLKGAKVSKGQFEGDMKYDLEESEGFMAKALTVCRFIIMIGIYVAGVAVVCSVFTIEHPNGAEHTPPLSPTMQCVINLAFQYFLVYFLVWVCITLENFFPSLKEGWLNKALNAVQAAKATVQFAPMLCVLFIATRMRALQMTNNKGAPQGWVQDGMYLASWSILIQFMMCLIMPFFIGAPYKVDTMDCASDGDVDEEDAKNEDKDFYESRKKAKTEKDMEAGWGQYVVQFFRYAALLALLGGVTTVIVGVFLMTPETANGRGAIPLIADGTLPVDLAPAPPGVNDIPGAKDAMKATGETVGTGVDGVNTVSDTVTSPVTNAAEGATEAVTG